MNIINILPDNPIIIFDTSSATLTGSQLLLFVLTLAEMNSHTVEEIDDNSVASILAVESGRIRKLRSDFKKFVSSATKNTGTPSGKQPSITRFNRLGNLEIDIIKAANHNSCCTENLPKVPFFDSILENHFKGVSFNDSLRNLYRDFLSQWKRTFIDFLRDGNKTDLNALYNKWKKSSSHEFLGYYLIHLKNITAEDEFDEFSDTIIALDTDFMNALRGMQLTLDDVEQANFAVFVQNYFRVDPANCKKYFIPNSGKLTWKSTAPCFDGDFFIHWTEFQDFFNVVCDYNNYHILLHGQPWSGKSRLAFYTMEQISRKKASPIYWVPLDQVEMHSDGLVQQLKHFFPATTTFDDLIKRLSASRAYIVLDGAEDYIAGITQLNNSLYLGDVNSNIECTFISTFSSWLRPLNPHLDHAIIHEVKSLTKNLTNDFISKLSKLNFSSSFIDRAYAVSHGNAGILRYIFTDQTSEGIESKLKGLESLNPLDEWNGLREAVMKLDDSDKDAVRLVSFFPGPFEGIDLEEIWQNYHNNSSSKTDIVDTLMAQRRIYKRNDGLLYMPTFQRGFLRQDTDKKTVQHINQLIAKYYLQKCKKMQGTLNKWKLFRQPNNLTFAWNWLVEQKNGLTDLLDHAQVALQISDIQSANKLTEKFFKTKQNAQAQIQARLLQSRILRLQGNPEPSIIVAIEDILEKSQNINEEVQFNIILEKVEVWFKIYRDNPNQKEVFRVLLKWLRDKHANPNLEDAIVGKLHRAIGKCCFALEEMQFAEQSFKDSQEWYAGKAEFQEHLKSCLDYLNILSINKKGNEALAFGKSVYDLYENVDHYGFEREFTKLACAMAYLKLRPSDSQANNRLAAQEAIKTFQEGIIGFSRFGSISELGETLLNLATCHIVCDNSFEAEANITRFTACKLNDDRQTNEALALRACCAKIKGEEKLAMTLGKSTNLDKLELDVTIPILAYHFRIKVGSNDKQLEQLKQLFLNP